MLMTMLSEDAARTGPDELAQRAGDYREQGYAVVRQVCDAAACAKLIDLFESTVKPYQRPLHRFQSHQPEPHLLDARGRVINPLLGVHRLGGELEGFGAACRALMDAPPLVVMAEALLQAQSGVAESFYFEVSRGTEAHQDLAYLPGVSKMVGAWVALEPVDAGSGAFYVYAGSHRATKVAGFGAAQRGPDPSREYLAEALQAVTAHGYERQVLRLETGDVVFFDGAVVHGSLPSGAPERTRHSLTFHRVPLDALEYLPRR